MDFWIQTLLTMALLNFMLNLSDQSRWIHNHVRHIAFVCPDHEEWEEVRNRLKGALESHLRGLEDQEQLDKSQMTIEECVQTNKPEMESRAILFGIGWCVTD